MPLFNQPNLSAGIDDALISTANSVPAFPALILVFTFLVILLGGSFNERRRSGSSNFSFWMLISGITTSFLALSMTIGEGMINLVTLGMVFGITILSAIWFFLNKQRGEI